jgi:hypothetical protein
VEESDSSISEVKLNKDRTASPSTSGQTKIVDAEDCAGDALKFTTLDIIHSRKFRE